MLIKIYRLQTPDWNLNINTYISACIGNIKTKFNSKAISMFPGSAYPTTKDVVKHSQK